MNKYDVGGLIAGVLGLISTVLSIFCGIKQRDDIDSRIDMALDRRANQ